MSLGAKRIYYILLAAIGLALVVVGFSVYMATGFLKKQSQDVSKARLQSMVVEERQRLLRKARTDIDKYKSLAQIAKSIVPQDKDQAKTVREITKLAGENKILLGSITFPASSLGDPKTPRTQLTPATGIPNVYVLPITVASDTKNSSDFDDFIKFLDALEHNRRTALVTGVALDPDIKKPGNIFFTLTLDEYIKP